LKSKKDILKELDSVCNEALTFLRSKDANIKEQVQAVDEQFKNVSYAESNDLEKQPYIDVLKELEDSLYATEMDETSLMEEHIYMTKIIDGLRKATEQGVVSFSGKKEQFKDAFTRYENMNSAYEKQILEIEDETDEKIRYREDIVANEDVLGTLKLGFDAFTKDYSPVSNALNIKQEKINIVRRERMGLSKEFKAIQTNYDGAYLNFKAAHKDAVDTRRDYVDEERKLAEMENINEMYEIHNTDIVSLQSKLQDLEATMHDSGNVDEDTSGALSILEKQLNKLQDGISEKDQQIGRLENEREWLTRQSNDKDLKIESLEDKLAQWDTNYKVFDKLVTDLGKEIGYPVNLNADGDGSEEDQNPMIPLIERVQAITRWLEENENILNEPTIIIEPEVNYTPYIIGALALGALMIKR